MSFKDVMLSLESDDIQAELNDYRQVSIKAVIDDDNVKSLARLITSFEENRINYVISEEYSEATGLEDDMLIEKNSPNNAVNNGIYDPKVDPEVMKVDTVIVVQKDLKHIPTKPNVAYYIPETNFGESNESKDIYDFLKSMGLKVFSNPDDLVAAIV